MAGRKLPLVSKVLSFISANPELFEPATVTLPPELSPPWILEGDLVSGVKSCIESGHMENAFSYLNSCLYLRTSTSIRGMSKLISFLRESFPVQVWTLRLLLLIKKKGCPFSRSLRVALEHIRLLYEGVYKAIHKEETGPLPRLRDVLVHKRGADLFLATETQLTPDIIQWIDLLYFLVSVLLKGPTETTIPMWEQLCTSMRKDLANERAFGPYLVCLNEIGVDGLSLPQEEQVTLLSSITTVEHFSCFNRLFVQHAMLEEAQFRLALLEKLHRLGLNKKLKNVIDLFHSERMDEFIDFFAEKLLASLRSSINSGEFHVALTYYYEYLRQGNYRLPAYVSRNLPNLLEVVRDPVFYNLHFELLNKLVLFSVQKPCGMEMVTDVFLMKLPSGQLPAAEKMELMLLLIFSRKEPSLFQILKDYISDLMDQMENGTETIALVQSLITRALKFAPELLPLVLKKQESLTMYLDSVDLKKVKVEARHRLRELADFTEVVFASHPVEEDDDLRSAVDKCIDMLTSKVYDSQYSEYLSSHFPLDTSKLTPAGVTDLQLLREHLICNLARSGMRNLKSLIERGVKDSITRYLTLFTALKHSLALRSLYNRDLHFYVHQFIVGYLRRIFLCTVGIDIDCAEFFETCDAIAVSLEMRTVRDLETHQKARAEQLINSELVQHEFKAKKLSATNFPNWVDRIAFAPLVRLHGITLFGGTILISDSYSREEKHNRFGFLLTLLHETTHLLRKVQQNVYDETALTPVLDAYHGYDEYPYGMPGTKVTETRSCNTEESHGEGGYQLEVSLFGMVISKLNSHQIDFLIDLQNWNIDKKSFNQQLEERASILNSKKYDYGRTADIYSFPRDNHSDW